ncbi:hypothetical protein [Sphingomonas immobilis]|uniref:Uncharacterized protein n=1 Tax=Sphingomonas immobilis TaxID=3063997 RepID=A0ABT8ZWR6_9SPHN|nr:hypothetical protein [Sphingomonas sp. CA1-15]MDO7841579.1 hypothetical protein [Sphingomonas sp. CA1-15]
MPLTLDDLFATPDHYLHSFAFSSGGDQAVFVPMDRAAYHRSIFLDGRISPAEDGSMALPLATVLQGVRPAAATAWIFHMAHVGSTLLARALDGVEASLVLREPLALRQCAIHPDDRRLALVLAMLGKRYRADAPSLVKANVPVNFLLPKLAGANPEARAILLYLPLRDYLLAILRNDEHRTWLRNVTGQLARYLGDLSALSDAERAAALWLAQARAFAGALVAMPGARALNAEAFFAEPEAVLNAAAAHLGVPLAPAAIAATVAGPLFSTYSKNPAQAFDNAARVARRQELERAISAELDAAAAWIARNAADDAEAPLIAGALIR